MQGIPSTFPFNTDQTNGSFPPPPRYLLGHDHLLKVDLKTSLCGTCLQQSTLALNRTSSKPSSLYFRVRCARDKRKRGNGTTGRSANDPRSQHAHHAVFMPISGAQSGLPLGVGPQPPHPGVANNPRRIHLRSTFKASLIRLMVIIRPCAAISILGGIETI